ncbi:hypothetical protein [Mesorhizobium sp. M0037]|uniref:hypothetical protein n=1 Tax=unclassified Mesorhizobium TaxID=325217 RepID=UPI003339F3F0
MVATPIEIARAATAKAASLLMWQKSMADPPGFRRDMDKSRLAIRASRELLKRLRHRYSDDVARGWEDADPAPVAVSAFQADILRSAFRAIVKERGVPECQWRDLAEALVHDLTECERIEPALVDWIVSK